ncbi:MAG: peptidoglycan binding domain-containing protein, partial [Oscillospiraceae bacterium]|nr:peptidoglycan binding domain-containing protein [Oscillospiraceae bacterium]
ETPELPEPETDMQKRIAEIKMAKIRQALAATHTENQPEEITSSDMPVPAVQPSEEISSVPEEPDIPTETEPSPEQASQTRKVRIKAVAVSDTASIPRKETEEISMVTEIPVPERPAPEPAVFPEAVSEDEASSEEKIPEKPEIKKTKSGTSKKKKKKNARSGAKMGVLIGAGCAGAIIAAYFIGAVSYQGKFLPRTYINSLSVAGMTTEEAHNALLEEKEVKDLTLITPKGESVVFAAQDFKAEYTIPTGALNEAANEGNFNWVSKLFKSSEYAVKYDYNYSEEDLKNLIQSYDWGSEVSQNAKIVRADSGKFEIQPETLGDKFDTNTLLNYIIEQLTAGKNTVTMEDSGCYENYRAKVKATDLEDDLEVYNRYANCNITFDFEDRKKLLDNDTIISWLLTKEDGSFVTTSGHDIPLNQDAIAEFVAEMADETDTFGKDHEFYATLDGWITVPWTYASCYGWQIDQKATVNQIIDLINAGDPVVVEPIYTAWGTGYTRATDDIGTTYIEVDISAQHFWYYRDNEVIMDYDIVSGTETNAERRTPRGICQIVGHVKGKTLGTYAVQGYEQWVDFWMPFNYYGCGFHDLSRGSYGGSVYMYNGSHGCLNMRWSEAQNLYNNIEDGLPVIVHD